MYQFLPNNPYERFKNPSKSSLRRFIESSVYWLNLLSSSLVIVLQSIYLSDLVTKTDDIAKIISSAAWIPVSLIALEGIVFTGRHQRRVTRLINVLELSFPKTTAGQEVASVQETHYKWNRLSRIVTGFYFLALYVIYTLNFTLATISYFLTDEWNLKLPRLLWYPFDPHSSVARSILVYVWECWGTQATTRAVVTMGVFLGSISNHICVQFDGLTRRFLELRPSERTVKSDYEKLISLLREHNYLIRVCEELGDIFRASLLVNYVLSSIVIGCFGFLILNEPVMTQKMEYIFDFICFMCYNCLFSIYGDALMERVRTQGRLKSEKLGNLNLFSPPPFISFCSPVEFRNRFSTVNGWTVILNTRRIYCSSWPGRRNPFYSVATSFSPPTKRTQR